MKAAVKVVRGDRKMQYVDFKDSGLYVWSLNADMLKSFISAANISRMIRFM